MSTLIAADRTVVERSFREWQAEQAELEAQLVESLAALEAYQSNLDNWQRELAAERAELRELRAAIELERSAEADQTQRLDAIVIELAEAREKVNSLTTALLARTEELRGLDRDRDEASAALAVAQARESELTALLAAQQAVNESQRRQWESEAACAREEAERLSSLAAAGNQPESARNCQSPTESRPAANPVLGSVMEQFGKLRQQRSMNRLNPKPR